MESINKILYYAEKLFYYIILAIAVIGIYKFISSDTPIAGGVIGVLIMGSAAIAEYFNLSRDGANIIFNSSLSLLLMSAGIHLFRLENKWYKILGTVLFLTALYFLATIFA
jgi:hypothetical protein